MSTSTTLTPPLFPTITVPMAILIPLGWRPRGVGMSFWTHPLAHLTDPQNGLTTKEALQTASDWWVEASARRTTAIHRSVDAVMDAVARDEWQFLDIGMTTMRFLADAMQALYKIKYTHEFDRINKQNYENIGKDKISRFYSTNDVQNVVFEYGDLVAAGKGLVIHGVNCQLAMGSGVAKALYTKHPVVRSQYMSKPELKLGDIDIVTIDKYHYDVINCYTQEYYMGHPNAPKDGPCANVDAIRTCLIKVCEYVNEQVAMHGPRMYHALDINLPLIGSDLGGLCWSTDVEPVLNKVARMYPEHQFYVWTI